jgi:hypothetical protein
MNLRLMNLRLKSSTLAFAARAAGIILLGAFALGSLQAFADGDAAPGIPQAPSGAIVGVVTRADGRPVARATVKAVRADGGSYRATLTGSDGSYSFSDLPPGNWSVASKVDGQPEVALAQVAVSASEATRYDMVMNASTIAAGPVAASGAAPVPRPIPALGHPTDSVLNDLRALVLPADRNKPIVVAQSAAAPAAAATPAPPAATVPEALQAPDAAPDPDNDTPFAFGDFTWVNGGSRQKAPTFDTKLFTPEIRFDANYIEDFNHPSDHTIVGSTEEFRAQEFQIEQVSFGGDFHWHNVKARFLSMMGLFATTTPPNDASSGVGQWQLHDAYKYLSEANAGYHWDIQHGLNVDAGIFVSYIGLFAYYNFDNWTYQPSYVSSNTPWFFNGLRIQWFPTNKLKIEPWLINGWQSYAKYNSHPGFGGQVLYTPSENVKWVFNSYTLGQDNLNSFTAAGQNPGIAVGTGAIGTANPNAPAITWSHVQRFHEDDSLLVKYYDAHGQSGAGISKAAFTLTWDLGCEEGGGVTCFRGQNKANFIGVMGYDRTWFDHDLYAITIGGGFMNNPGRYLALTPPINGSSAQINSPYFTQAPGLGLFQWDAQINFQYMPNDWITWWLEPTFRHSNVPYFAGTGGVTPPGGNTSAPGSYVCMNSTAAGSDNCASEGGIWYPDLRTREFLIGAGVMVRF